MDVGGIWYNELNSTMFLEVAGKTISGWYISAVGEASGPYDLIGFLDEGRFPTLAWVVVWRNQHKEVPVVTAWSGQAQTLEGGIDQIDSMWILTESTAVKEDWQSQMIGKDVFNRAIASAEDVRRAMASKGIKKLNVEPGTAPPKP